MDEYFDAEPVTKGYDAQIARRILLYLKPYRLYAIIAILALAIATAGELISPTIIKRAIDDVVVRDWYGIDPSAKYILPKDEGSLEVRIGGRIYVRASRLAGLTMAERNRLFEQGLLDNEASYVFPLDPMREEKISIAERISKVELSDNWGVIPSSVLRTLRSEDAAILRAADDKALLRFGLILLIVLLIVLGATFAMTWFTNQISTLIMKDMRLELFHHVIEQSLSYLSRQPVGRLVTRLTSDIEVISQFFSDFKRFHQRCFYHDRISYCTFLAELETGICRTGDNAFSLYRFSSCAYQGARCFSKSTLLTSKVNSFSRSIYQE